MRCADQLARVDRQLLCNEITRCVELHEDCEAEDAESSIRSSEPRATRELVIQFDGRVWRVPIPGRQWQWQLRLQLRCQQNYDLHLGASDAQEFLRGLIECGGGGGGEAEREIDQTGRRADSPRHRAPIAAPELRWRGREHRTRLRLKQKLKQKHT